MNEIVKTIKSKLHIKGLNKADEFNLRYDIQYLIDVMSLGKNRKANVANFRKLLLNRKSIVDEPNDAKDSERYPEDNIQFRILYQKHRDLLVEIETKQIEVLLCSGSSEMRDKKSYYYPLKNYALPSHILDTLASLTSPNSTEDKFQDLQSELTEENYINRFKTLLWIEEAYQAISLRRYDLENVNLKKYCGNQYKLNVPGLAEGRPSLLRGDRLILRTSGRKQVYEGFVKSVQLKDIIVEFNRTFSKVDHLSFDVCFMVTRTPFRRCHHAVEKTKMDVLFPNQQKQSFKERRERKNYYKNNKFYRSKRSEKKEKSLGPKWFSKNLNIHQERAVINILEDKCKPAPYIIFGPPGTGKTVTMVEAILQVNTRFPNYKILVCGNSNYCADSLALRIKQSGAIELDKLIRIASYSSFNKLLPGISDITLDMGGISDKVFKQSSIIVTTCIQAFALNDFRQKFDYVFIDEAGHASEPEALISIGLMRPNGCLVLAGDPHQLGPVCMSKVAENNGFSVSLLERLCKLPIYQRRIKSEGADDDDEQLIYDERYLTKLIVCYRSDSRVMAVNNKLFYENELEFEEKTPQKWLDLFNSQNPLMFQEIKGKDLRDFRNPSWFNANEAIICLSYVYRLYKNGLKSKQLGIITPYRLQIDKLNLLFEMLCMEKCKISTMEDFQGDEREVIIILTVRSSVRNIKFDKEFNLGFLFNPKRFNVATSRAKWLVIVLGDSEILKRDNCWVNYMKVAHKL